MGWGASVLDGDGVDDGGDDDEAVGVVGRFTPHVEEGGGVGLREMAGLDDPRDDAGPKGVGPGPEGRARGGDALVCFEVDEGEFLLAEVARGDAHDVVRAFVAFPIFEDAADGAGEGGVARGDGHGAPVEIVLDDDAAARLEGAVDLGEGGAEVVGEGEDPAAVGGVEGGEFVLGERGGEVMDVGAADLGVVEVEGGHAVDKGVDVGGGALDAEDAAGGPDEFGEVGGGVAGAGADVEDV